MKSFIIPKGSTCGDCIHAEICSIKKDFKILCEDSVEKLKLMENANFRLSAHCKFYEKEKSNIDIVVRGADNRKE